MKISDVKALSIERKAGIEHRFETGRIYDTFVFIKKGSIRFASGQFHFDGKENDILYFPRGDQTYTHYMKDSKVLLILIESFNLFSERPKVFHSNEILCSSFESAVSANNENLMYLNVYQILYELEKGVFETYKINNALVDIGAHFYENRKISEYAKMCAMSETSFRSAFLKITGTSPVKYRNDLRLSKARDYILSGEYTVSEVSELTGFQSLSFFSREFKKKYGVMPSSIKKN